MERNLNVLGVLYIVLGAIGFLIATLFIAGFVSGNLALSDLKTVEITPSMATAATLLMILISIPQVIAGVGLLERAPWALLLTNLLSVVNLFSFPFGTAVGIYSLWLLSKPEARALLRPLTNVSDAK